MTVLLLGNGKAHNGEQKGLLDLFQELKRHGRIFAGRLGKQFSL